MTNKDQQKAFEEYNIVACDNAHKADFDDLGNKQTYIDAFKEGAAFAHGNQQKRIDELETLLNNLAIATNNYRNYHDLYGKGDLRTGRAWDEMARYERKAIYNLEEQNND